jgi:hypothetical protein
MLKVAALIYIILAPTLALGSWVAVLSTSTTMASGSAMVYAFAGGMLAGIPGSFIIAKMIEANRRKMTGRAA